MRNKGLSWAVWVSNPGKVLQHNGYRVFPWSNWPGRDVEHPPYLAPRLKKSKAIPLLPLCAFMASSRIKLTFTFTCIIKAYEAEKYNTLYTVKRVSNDIVTIDPLTLVSLMVLITILYSAEVKNTWNRFSTTPYVFMEFCLIKNRGDFTFPRRMKHCQCLAFAVCPRFNTLSVICYYEWSWWFSVDRSTKF